MRRPTDTLACMAEVRRFAHHMSDEDALMWNIEKDPILRSTIVAVAMFDSVPDWNVLRRRMERTTRLIPRFRQRVLSPPFRIGPPRWSVEADFDLDFHLRRTACLGRRHRRRAARRAAADGDIQLRPGAAAVGVHADRRSRRARWRASGAGDEGAPLGDRRRGRHGPARAHDRPHPRRRGTLRRWRARRAGTRASSAARTLLPNRPRTPGAA